MTVADIPATFEVRVSTTENAITMSELKEKHGLTPESLAAAMAGSLQGWVCEVDDRIVAFVMGDEGTGEIAVLAVRPGYEKRGIGKQLLSSMSDCLFESGHDRIWLLTTPDSGLRAYGFYQSLGWHATGELIDEDHEKFVLHASR